jgi:hypothetical protein
MVTKITLDKSSPIIYRGIIIHHCVDNSARPPGLLLTTILAEPIRIAATAVVRICVLRNYLFNVCYLGVGVIWAVLYMIL